MGATEAKKYWHVLNPNPHGLFLNDFTQSDISALNGLIFKIFFCLKDFSKFLLKIVERTP